MHARWPWWSTHDEWLATPCGTATNCCSSIWVFRDQSDVNSIAHIFLWLLCEFLMTYRLQKGETARLDAPACEQSSSAMGAAAAAAARADK
jgi:hypothetical protein